MKTIKEVKVGDKVNNNRNGNGLVASKTKRTIKVVFENGNTVKNSYKYDDAPFYDSDF